MTDIEGNLLKVKVHDANIHDTVGGCEVFYEAYWYYKSIQAVCGDAGYKGTFVEYVESLGLKCDISERIKPEFEILPKRWRVERTFAWQDNYRRLSKDYEVTAVSEENFVIIANIAVLLRRLFKVH